MFNNDRVNTVINKMIEVGSIPSTGGFEVTQSIIDEYYNIYHKCFGKTGKKNKNNNVKYAKKLAGITFMKINIERENQEIKINRSKKPKCGILYIISNPAFPGMYKIGMTRDLDKRLSQYQTADPYRRYKVEVCKFVYDVVKEEKELLETLKTNVVKGEWVSTEKIKEIFIGKYPSW